MRDHHKLRAFDLADELAILVYRYTKTFPKEEMFGLTSQMRRAAVSVASNIVEGCARSTKNEYLRFLEIAYGSAQELQYHISLAHRLSYLPNEDYDNLSGTAVETCKVLAGLIRSFKSD
jgi:four helix bundle protein